MSLTDTVTMLGGIAPTHALLRRRWSARRLARAVHTGELLRVRQGWYALPDYPAARLKAWRVGGGLTCSAGAAEHGLWTRLLTPPIHVRVAHNTPRRRSPIDPRRRLERGDHVVLHWTTTRRIASPLASVLDCLLDMTACESPEYVVAAADSALHSVLIDRGEWLAAIATLPLRLRALLSDVDGLSESITESLTRFRLHRQGIALRTQVWVTRDIRVDLLVGRRLVIELDGRHHSTPEQFERDRRRDARLSALGYRVLHFSYAQVVSDWAAVRASILAAISRGDHL